MESVSDSLNVFLVSDATGSTAESVLASVRVQFPKTEMAVRRFTFVRSEEQVDALLAAAPERECVVLFTIVSESLRRRLSDGGRKKGLTMVDVMGRLLHVFSRVLHRPPESSPGALVHEKEELILLGEAIRYTMRHDDGLHSENWKDADLIILGPSRTGKTPTSIYLSCRRLKVANIPLVMELPFPDQIARLPVRKVGFLMNPKRLRAIRASRINELSPSGVRGYTNERRISEELFACEEFYKRIPRLKTLDVTDRSIEEVSEWIIRHVL